MSPFPPEDGRVPLSEEARGWLGRALAEEGPLLLPRVPDLPDPVLVRWLHRAWVAERGVHAPLIQVEGPPGPWRDALAAAAAGGWLHLPALESVRADTRVVIVEAHRMLRLDGVAVAAIRAADRFYAVAVDPTLAPVRAALCGLGGVGALLVGPERSTLDALARWAWWRAGGDAPLVAPEAADEHPEAWVLVADPDTLDAPTRRVLRDRARPPRPAAAPVSSAPPRPTDPAFAPILGESPALRRVLADAARAAPSVASVLLLGEPGVGKELFARAIHAASGRSGPFEAVDLGAVPPDLLESELFGHVRGAFTGAATERLGAFRRAHRGTLFLDEIGNLDGPSQARLLRVLQERVVRPVGSDRTLPVDVRVIAATNTDITAPSAAFRADLLHRLNAITLRLPPLRERPEDIVPLAARLLAQARGESREAEITPEAAERLRSWRWPGNVRELAGLLLRAAAFGGPGAPLTVDLLDPIPAPRVAGPVVVLADTPDRAGPDAPALALEVPALADRGAAAIDVWIAAGAGGRVLTPEAWAVLREAARPVERLEGLLAGVRRHDGVVDAAVVRVLAGAAGPGGLVFVVAPGAGGAGFERRVDTDNVVLGRAGSLAEVQGAAGDPRGAARVAAVRAVAGPDPAFLPIPFASELSRAHVAVRRRGATLVVERLAGAAAPTAVRAAGASRVPLAPGAPVQADGAVEISVDLDPRGRRRLVVQVYVDEAARARLAGAFGEPTPTAGADETAQADPPAGPGRVWPLSADEGALLAAIVLGFPGGDFSAWLRAALTPVPPVARDRLAPYLLSVRPTQYCARLYAFPGNTEARAALQAAIAARPDATRFGALLPAQLAAVLAT